MQKVINFSRSFEIGVDGSEVTTITVESVDMQAYLDETGNSLNNDTIEALENDDINLLYHNYDPDTKELTLQVADSADDSSETFDAYTFIVLHNNESYHCYTTNSNSDLAVNVQGRLYYCNRLE